MLRRSSAAVALSTAILTALAALGTVREARAELPAVQLNSIFPAGGKQGTTVEVTLTGSDFEGVDELYFDHPGLNAEQVTQEKDGKKVPVANRFKITIPADAPLGAHDVRAVGRYGISNPRTFEVGDLEEMSEKEPNNTREQAMRIMDSQGPSSLTVNGQITGATDIDCFVFWGRAGQRILIDCQAQRIDSRLNGRLTLYGPDGKVLVVDDDFFGRDPFLDYTLPDDAEYTVLLTDQVYDGGVEYFYRLSIGTFPHIDYVFPPAAAPGTKTQFTLFGRNLPGSQPAEGVQVDGPPLERLEVEIAVPTAGSKGLQCSGLVLSRECTADGFEYRWKTSQGSSNPVRIGFTDLAVLAGSEPNDSLDQAQLITPPCEVYAQFQARNDVDWYRFMAKGKERWIFEVISQRAGFPTDAFLWLRQAKGGREVGSADDDGTSPVGLRFDLRSDDPTYRSPSLTEGEYQVAVRDLYAATRGGPRYVYRLRVRPERPDFRLFVMHNSPQGNATNPPGSLLIRQGGNQHLDVYALRRDGFSGEITLQVEGLPEGVRCYPTTIGPDRIHAPLVFSASEEAPATVATIQVTGKAEINGQEVIRTARPGVITWAFNPQGRMPAQSRLTRSLVLAVRPGAPYRIVAKPDKVTISRGIPLKLKLQVTRQGDFKGQVAGITAANLPRNARNATAKVAANKSEADITFNFPTNVPKGNYTIALRSNTPVPFTKDPKGKKKNVSVTDISTPVQLTVTDPLKMTCKLSPATVKKGSKVELVVTTTRLGGFSGPVQLQLINLPRNVRAEAVTVDPKSSEGKLVITANENAATGSFPKVAVRARVKAGGNINIDTPVTLNVE